MDEEGGWIPEEAWRRAREQWDQVPVPRLSVPVVDEHLGVIAVLRWPDGREVYGADSAFEAKNKQTCLST